MLINLSIQALIFNYYIVQVNNIKNLVFSFAYLKYFLINQILL